MIDNTLLLKDFLVTENKDEFYHGVVIKRKKNHPNLDKDKVILNFTLTSDNYNKVTIDLINLCFKTNSTAYIYPSKRSFKSISYDMMDELTNQIRNESFNIKNIFKRTCERSRGLNRYYLIDVDTKDTNEIKETLLTKIEPLQKITIYKEIPTKNRFHLITSPFNVDQFLFFYQNINVHKNSPTVLISVE